MSGVAAEQGANAPDPWGIIGTVQAKVFHVQRAVAEGGFGVVYRAYHDAFRSPVALKCLKLPEGLTEVQRKEFLERFRTEAELMFRLSAALPEVVRPLQLGVLETEAFVPFLALEWLEGQTLDTFVEARTKRGKPPVGISTAVEILAPIARVLARAHRFNDRGSEISIIHRDLKPENVFLQEVDGDRVTRILDFGIARVKAETNALAGKVTGGDALAAFSPAYAAPEQWSPQTYGATGPWTDVYGLALTLCEVILGRAPVSGDLTAMMGAALNPDSRPTPGNRGLKVFPAIEAAFQSALAVDPKERTQSVEKFWSQIELAVGRSPSITRRAGTSLQAISEPPPPMPPPTAGQEISLPELGVVSQAPARSAPSPGPLTVPSRVPAMKAPSFDEPPAGLDLGVGLDIDRRSVRSPTPVRSPRPPLGVRADYAPGSAAWSPGVESRGRSFGDRFGAPAWLIALALAIGGADIVYTQMTGQRFALGPIRPFYLAAPMAVFGIVLLLIRLFDE